MLIIFHQVHLQRHRCQKQYQPNEVSDLHDSTVGILLTIDSTLMQFFYKGHRRRIYFGYRKCQITADDKNSV